MSRIDKCKKKCDIITFSENKVSTKMLQAMMLKKGGAKISYHNSRTRSTHTTIMSLNYLENRLLLLSFKFKLYQHYITTLSNINRDLYAKILQMLDTLVANLTQQERDIVFDTVPIVIETPELFDESGVVFKVVAKRIRGFSYFIVTNINNSYSFDTGLIYTFDLSDPTNLGTTFCLSLKKDSVAYDCRYHLTPGEPGATMRVYLSRNIPYSKLYIFNRDDENVRIRYDQWGYSLSYIFVNRDKIVIDVQKPTTFRTFDTPYLKFVMYDWYGPKVMMEPFVSSDPRLSSNQVHIYKNNYIYKFGVGVYTIYVNNYYSFAFLNRLRTSVGITGEYNRGTKQLDQLFLAGSGLDGEYTFYSGLIQLTILDKFDPITLYNDRFGYMGGLFMIQYSDTTILKSAVPQEFFYTSIGNLYGLDSHSKLDPVQITFQNIPYLAENRFALSVGMYTIYNTTDIPIALLNLSKENWISIEGISRKTVNEISVLDAVQGIGPQGEECLFYYGTVRIRVRGNFGQCSLYTPRKGLSEGGYRGGYSLLVYDERFNNVETYSARGMLPPVIPPNTEICTIPIEIAPKPLLAITLSANEYTMNENGLFLNGQAVGDITQHEFRLKLKKEPYTFTLVGSVTLYGTTTIDNSYTLGITSTRILSIPVRTIYPVYSPPPNRSTTTFFILSIYTEDFCIVYKKGNIMYTYFMTYAL